MQESNGFYYMRARYYDPEVQRFISEDPVGFEGGINLYAYANNNPINFLDPLGLEAQGTGSSAMNWYLYESVVPGPYGQPVSEWTSSGPTEWGNPMKYTEEAGGTWMWAERGAVGISAAAAVTAGTLIGLEAAGISNIGTADVGWKGGEITLTRPGAQTPDWRFNPLGHYHRRPGIGNHRPWEGGW